MARQERLDAAGVAAVRRLQADVGEDCTVIVAVLGPRGQGSSVTATLASAGELAAALRDLAALAGRGAGEWETVN